MMAVSTCGGSESNMAVDSDTLTDESDDEVIPSREESEFSFSMDTRECPGSGQGDYSPRHGQQQNINSGIYKNLRVRKTRFVYHY